MAAPCLLRARSADKSERLPNSHVSAAADQRTTGSTHLAPFRSHACARQLAGLLHPGGELSFVELVVLVDNSPGGTGQSDAPRKDATLTNLVKQWRPRNQPFPPFGGAFGPAGPRSCPLLVQPCRRSGERCCQKQPRHCHQPHDHRPACCCWQGVNTMAWQHAIGSRDPIRRHSGAGVLHVALELGLDKYTADYAACRWRRTEAIGSAVSTRFISHNLARFAGWLSPLRATREVWLFSRKIGRDWRQSGS